MSRKPKSTRRVQASKTTTYRDNVTFIDNYDFAPRQKVNREPLKPMNESQKKYLSFINSKDITFGVGAAGTGKSYIAVAWAADQFKEGNFEKIIITRPVVEAGEEIGFLKGDLEEKLDPYLQPIRDILNERLGSSYVENLLKNGKIDVRPLAYMRGSSFKNCIVILDEAQNTSPAQMKMFLTRIGEGSKFIINGDTKQSDLKITNGLWDAQSRLYGNKNIGFVNFTVDDIVRHGIIREIIEAYED